MFVYWGVILLSFPLFFMGSKKSLYLLLLVVLLSLFSSFQSIDVSPDREAYIDFFKYFSKKTVGDTPFSIEPFFYFIYKSFNQTIAMQVLAFFIVCLMGLSMKFFLIYRYSPHVGLSVIVFLSYLFLLQDMNQIRVGLALGFIYLSMIYYYEGNRLRWLFFVFIATCFHYSSIIAFLAPLYIYKNISKQKLLLALVVIFLVAVFWSLLGGAGKAVSILASIDPTGKLLWYLNHSNPEAINPVKRLLPHFLFLIPIVLKYDLIHEKHPYMGLFVPLYLMYIFSFLILSPIPVLAYRVSDIFLFSSVFVLPGLSLIFKEKLIARVLVITFSLFQFIYVVYVLDFFGPYVLV